MRLVADPKEEGSVAAAASAGSFTPNTDFNVSMVEYELIPVPVPAPAPAPADVSTPMEAAEPAAVEA